MNAKWKKIRVHVMIVSVMLCAGFGAMTTFLKLVQ